MRGSGRWCQHKDSCHLPNLSTSSSPLPGIASETNVYLGGRYPFLLQIFGLTISLSSSIWVDDILPFKYLGGLYPSLWEEIKLLLKRRSSCLLKIQDRLWENCQTEKWPISSLDEWTCQDDQCKIGWKELWGPNAGRMWLEIGWLLEVRVDQTKYSFTQSHPACNSEKSFDLLSEKWRQRLCIEDYLIPQPFNKQWLILQRVCNFTQTIDSTQCALWLQFVPFYCKNLPFGVESMDSVVACG